MRGEKDTHTAGVLTSYEDGFCFFPSMILIFLLFCLLCCLPAPSSFAYTTQGQQRFLFFRM